MGNSIFLKPKPAAGDVTLAKGLKVYFKRDITEFTPASTTTEPGCADNFHPICSVGPASELAPKYAPYMIATLREQLKDLQEEIKGFYGRRHTREMRPRINPHTESHI